MRLPRSSGPSKGLPEGSPSAGGNGPLRRIGILPRWILEVKNKNHLRTAQNSMLFCEKPRSMI